MEERWEIIATEFYYSKRKNILKNVENKMFWSIIFPYSPLFHLQLWISEGWGEKKTIKEQSIKATTCHYLESECLGTSHWDSWGWRQKASYLGQKSQSEPYLNSPCFQTNTWMAVVHNWILTCVSASLRVS